MSLIPQPVKALEIFYAYEHKDHEWRDLLEAHLSGLRRQGLITGWYDRNISAGKTWSHEIDSHLATADIILLLISSDFLASEYCYCIEMTRAMERHHAGEARVIPIILRPTDWQGTPFEQLRVLPNNTQPVSRWQDHDEAMLDVVRGIKKVIEEINEASSNQLSTYNSPISAPIYPIWNIPYNRNPFFTGREDILTRIHDTFITGKATSSVQAISGLGGIGKTQIAIEYAYRYHYDYGAIFWIRADSHEILISDFVNIAVLLNLPQKNRQDQNQVADAVKRWLQSNTYWLLIFDNAEDLALIREYIPTVNKGHILLTTRSRVMRRIARTIEIGKLRPEEGALFLLRWANIIAIDAPFSQAMIADRAKASEISFTMDGLPLALDQAGAYIEETACSLSDYLELYRKYSNLLLKRRGNVAIDHPEPVSTTWSYSFDKIQQTNPAAAELLRFCSFLHPDAIPEEIIVEGAPELGPILYPVAIDSFELNDTIGDLLKFSLLQRNSEAKTLTIHRLVQTVIKAGMDNETQRIWAERTTRAVNRSLPDVDLGPPQLYQRCLPHAQLCIALIEQWSMVFTEAAQLLYQIG